MSSFSELRIALNEPCLSISLSHHPTSPILALLRPLSISFHDVYGCAIEGKVVAKKIQPTVMEWHPNQRILAIGWKNGTISLYQEDTNTLRDETEVHKSELILLKYNPVGTRMITCDSNGLVCVWRGITCLSKYQRSGLINLCCFAELNLEPTQKLGNLFFFGGSQGVVTLADDSNHLSEICKVGGSIVALQFYAVPNQIQQL